MAGMSASDQGVGGDATGECIPRHCVVTGALGGIGAAVVTAAKEAGYRVTAVDQAPHGETAGADGDVAGVGNKTADLPVFYALDVTDADLTDLGLDSVRIIDIVEWARRHGWDAEFADLIEDPTIDAWVDAFEESDE